MVQIVAGLFADSATAASAVRALESAGFGDDHIRTVGQGEFTPDAVNDLDAEAAAFYEGGVARGGMLVVVTAQPHDATLAADTLAEYGPVRVGDDWTGDEALAG